MRYFKIIIRDKEIITRDKRYHTCKKNVVTVKIADIEPSKNKTRKNIKLIRFLRITRTRLRH